MSNAEKLAVYRYSIAYSSTEYDVGMCFAEPEKVLVKLLETQKWIRTLDGYWLNVSKIRAIKYVGTDEIKKGE